jgi:uncharacterized protein YcbK (DUF882 family)
MATKINKEDSVEAMVIKTIEECAPYVRQVHVWPMDCVKLDLFAVDIDLPGVFGRKLRKFARSLDELRSILQELHATNTPWYESVYTG